MGLFKLAVVVLFAVVACSAEAQEAKMICVSKEEQKTRLGVIEKYSEQTLGSMEGTIGAILGGVLGNKIDGGNDATMVLGAIIGNKLGNDIKRKKIKDSEVCYQVVEEVQHD